jgi:phage terminase large subunit GpA-like protein
MLPSPLKLVEWADDNIVLPATQSARPGAYRTWPYLREPLEAIGARSPEYVTIQKSSRIGFTKGLMIAIAGMVATDPCSIGLLAPVDEDARDYVIDELEPLFTASPALRGLIRAAQYRGQPRSYLWPTPRPPRSSPARDSRDGCGLPTPDP